MIALRPFVFIRRFYQYLSTFNLNSSTTNPKSSTINLKSSTMHLTWKPFLLASLLLLISSSAWALERQHDFNKNWLFKLGDNTRYNKNEAKDADWRQLTVPHDWSVEHPFDQSLNGATAYLPGGIGWYRKHFKTPVNLANTKVILNFDGIYNHSEIWLNGNKVGGEVYGYVPFTLDVTEHLNPNGENNVVAIRVDRSRYIDSRWYPGAGIYRDVTLVTLDRLHIPVWGTFITTPKVTDSESIVKVAIDLVNDYKEAKSFTVITDIYSPKGKLVATHSSHETLAAKSRSTVAHQLTIAKTTRWDIDSPKQYRAVNRIAIEGKDIDQVATKFGFRTFEFHPEKGFFLNGKHHKIKGVNLHHDGGLVGAAVPRDVWVRRLERLKEAGVNAIRTSHNPPSAEFLDLCDEMGFIVQDEVFDEWDNPKDKRKNMNDTHSDTISRGYADWFQTHAEKDLKRSLKRDRNHPSIMMWSIGNEIEWTYPRVADATGYFDADASGNYFFNPPRLSPDEIGARYKKSTPGKYSIEKTAKKLSDWVKEMDTTRPVTANLILPSASYETGYADALDIIGYSYRRVIYDYGHKHYPGKSVYGGENVPQWHEWKAVKERDFVAGTFLWTGIDYLGESHEGWPKKTTYSGLLDTAGFYNHSFHMFKSLWNDEPHVHLTTQTVEKSLYKPVDGQLVEKKKDAWQKYLWFWHDVNDHWNYQEGEAIAVEVYSNCESVELLLNGQSYGKQMLASHADNTYKWLVPYQAGKLIAKGVGQCKAKDTIRTTSDAYTIAITRDRKKLDADGVLVSHLELQLVDKKGLPVTHQELELTLDLTDNLQLLGVDNGAFNSVQRFQSHRITTSNGRALAIVKGANAGRALVTASGKGLKSKKVKLKVLRSH